MKLKLTEKITEAIEPPTEVAQAYYWDTEDTGFGLVVGRAGTKTFVVYSRVGKRKVKVKIGVAAPGPWNVARARRRAKEILGEMASGVDPREGSDGNGDASAALTLRQALELHLEEMADNERRKISMETMRYDVTRLLAQQIDRPLAELTVEAVQKIKQAGRHHRTQTNRLLAHLSAIWTTARRLRRTTFHAESPVGRLGVQKYSLTREHEPERPRVHDADLPEWLRRVDSLSSSIRRDLQMLALFTGLRDANATRLRWEIVNWELGGFVIPMSKTTPFTVPFSSTVREILHARRAENSILFAKQGDGGWIFPTLNRAGKVTSIKETKERRFVSRPWLKHGPAPADYTPTEKNAPTDDTPTKKNVLFLPGMHALRRTFLSVADDIGVPRHVQKLLSNHSFGGRDVHDDYLRAEWSRIAEWVDKIDEALWARLGGRRPRKPSSVTVHPAEEPPRVAPAIQLSTAALE